MEFVGSYIFNRGQQITLWEGPKSYRASVQLINSRSVRFLTGSDLDRLTYRAMALVKRDVAKDGQELVLREQEGDPLPVRVKTEDEEVKEFVQDLRQKYPGMFSSIQKNVTLGPEYRPEGEYTNGTNGGDSR